MGRTCSQDGGWTGVEDNTRNTLQREREKREGGLQEAGGKMKWRDARQLGPQLEERGREE